MNSTNNNITEIIDKNTTENTDKNIAIGISACLVGENVRFDASSKTSNFCVKELGQYVSYKAFCPEVAIGMPIPRATIRQIKKDDVIQVSRPDGSGEVTEALQAYGKKIAKIANNLTGYVFCAKSPTCGMERVKIYSPEGNSLKSDGIGIFAKEIMRANPLLPCEENGRLNDAIIRENFVERVFAYKKWQNLISSGATLHKLMTFHSHHKYSLMSHDNVAYKQLGRLLANANIPLEEKIAEYGLGFMNALKIKATRKKHSNVLQHLQGYFSKQLNSLQRAELGEQINAYRAGLVPLVVPLTLLKHYLLMHPKDYIANQTYLDPYPEQLKLRYGY